MHHTVSAYDSHLYMPQSHAEDLTLCVSALYCFYTSPWEREDTMFLHSRPELSGHVTTVYAHRIPASIIHAVQCPSWKDSIRHSLVSYSIAVLLEWHRPPCKWWRPPSK